jgi:MFS family permease
VIILGLLLIAAGLVLASRAAELWQVYVAYGLGVGVGVGFTYVPAIAAVQPWFVRQRAFASGVAVAGIGVGTLVVPVLAARLIESAGWRAAYLVMAAAALLGIGAALLIDHSPARRGLSPDGEAASATAASTGPGGAPAEGPGLRRALRSRSFRLLYAASTLNSLGVFIPFVHIAAFAQDLGLPERTGVVMIGFIGVGSIVGRFALGAAADRLGRRRSVIGMYGGIAVMMLWWLGADEAWALALFALLFGAFYGGLVALMPAIISDYFGGREISGIIGLLYTSVAAGALVGPPLAGLAYDLGQSYTAPILAGALVNAASIACLLRLGEPRPWPARA